MQRIHERNMKKYHFVCPLGCSQSHREDQAGPGGTCTPFPGGEMHENGATSQRGALVRGHRHGHQALPHSRAGRWRRHVRLYHEARRRTQ